MSTLQHLCERIATAFVPYVICDREGAPYLSRRQLCSLGGWCVFLHTFHKADHDHELHNHPSHGLSVILVGGYTEERLDGRAGVRARERGPGCVNLIDANTFHRIASVRGTCWTLYACGPQVQEWGFWCCRTGIFTPWREFLQRTARAA